MYVTEETLRQILSSEHEGEKQLGRLKRRWKIVDWSLLAQGRVKSQSSLTTIMKFRVK
jgi:hypothetical protein